MRLHGAHAVFAAITVAAAAAVVVVAMMAVVILATMKETFAGPDRRGKLASFESPLSARELCLAQEQQPQANYVECFYIKQRIHQ